MKAYAALMSGIDTQLKIFKTFEEAKIQALAWFGESMMETITDSDEEMWNKIFAKCGKYENEDADAFCIYDDTIETTYEVISVDIPFVFG